MGSFRYLFLLFIGVLQAHAQLEWVDYPYPLSDGLEQRLRFGYLTVPETRNSTNTRFLKIGFCILKSNSPNPRKDAVIYLPGGPGSGFTASAVNFLQNESITRLREERDIVLFDPRGCGTSEPQLCYGLEDINVINAHVTGISQEAYWEGISRAMRACRDSLPDRGIDPSAYGSADIAADMEALREALGYNQWNLRGHSYGSRYAQSSIRNYPETIRSAILSGIVPASPAYEDMEFYGLTHSLRLLFDQCNASETCKTAYPNLEQDLFKILKRLDTMPMVLPAGALSTMPETPVIINPKLILYGIFLSFYIREGFEMAPLLIHTAANGQDWIIEAITIALSINFDIDGDMFHVIRCNDNPCYRFAPKKPEDDSMVEMLYPYWLGDHVTTEESRCANLGIILDSLEQLPVHSDIPMLLFSGEFDPATPTYYTDSIARYFSNATSFVVPGRGHDSPKPIADLIPDFFINPEQTPNLEFLRGLKPAEFLVGVYPNKGISAISVRLAKNDSRNLAISISVIAFMIVAGFLFFTYRLLRTLLKRRGWGVEIKRYLPIWLTAFISILLIALFALALKDAMARHLYHLVFPKPGRFFFNFPG